MKYLTIEEIKKMREADAVIDCKDYLVVVRLPEEMAPREKKETLREIIRIILEADEMPQVKKTKFEKQKANER